MSQMSMPLSLEQAFAAAAGLPPERISSALDIELSTYVAAARSPGPDYGLELLEFVRYLAERSPDGALPPARHAADLWLACACTRGIPLALARFHCQFGPLIARVLARRGADPDVAADIRNELSERMLLSDPSSGRRAKIADYRGVGALKSWVASAAATTLLSVQRAAARRRERLDRNLDDAMIARLDPELEYFKQHYAIEVGDAIVAAAQALEPRSKAILRLHLRGRLGIDALANIYGINRATAARRLAAARDSLRRNTVRDLRARLQLEAGECDRLLALVSSRLDVSLLRHLDTEH